MVSTYRHIPVLPQDILSHLAYAHVLLSEEKDRNGDFVRKERLGVAMFCSMVWGRKEWQERLQSCQSESLDAVYGGKISEANVSTQEKMEKCTEKGRDRLGDLSKYVKTKDEELSEILKDCLDY